VDVHEALVLVTGGTGYVGSHAIAALKTLRRRISPNWEINDDGVERFRPAAVAVTRYRYRGSRIPTPWSATTTGSPASAA
jgi:RNA-directed DNA polymerase